MSESRRVLAVDEQRATLEFLHSVLPLVEGEQFEILRVLSAEEGLLELRNKPYDLLIAGYRLPGMDGLELSRRAKRLRPGMGVILVSNRPLPELQEQATASGADHLLQKPLDAEEFLAAVQASLVDMPLAATPAAESYVSEMPEALPSAAIRRLEMLCDETGAGQVVLATVAGEILHVTGGQLHRDIPRLVAVTSASVSRALELSLQLNEREPKAVQFVEGLTTDLYWANVGREHFIAILFDAQGRRGRIGTVWVFAQRAVGELNKLLAAHSPAEPDSVPSAVPTAEEGASPPQDEAVEDELAQEAAVEEPAEAEPKPVEAAEVSDGQPPPTEALDVDPGEDEAPERSAKDLEIDAFWDEVLATDAGGDDLGTGISLEEARARGLVADDFDPDSLKDQDGD